MKRRGSSLEKILSKKIKLCEEIKEYTPIYYSDQKFSTPIALLEFLLDESWNTPSVFRYDSKTDDKLGFPKFILGNIVNLFNYEKYEEIFNDGDYRFIFYTSKCFNTPRIYIIESMVQTIEKYQWMNFQETIERRWDSMFAHEYIYHRHIFFQANIVDDAISIILEYLKSIQKRDLLIAQFNKELKNCFPGKQELKWFKSTNIK